MNGTQENELCITDKLPQHKNINKTIKSHTFYRVCHAFKTRFKGKTISRISIKREPYKIVYCHNLAHKETTPCYNDS